MQSLKIHKGEYRKLYTHELFVSEKKLKVPRTVEFFKLYHSLKEKLNIEPIKITLHDNQEQGYLTLNEGELASVT